MTDAYLNPDGRRWTQSAPAPDPRPFHAALPGYRPTPLVELPPLAVELGVGRVLVKDESSRLGLPAFKILGASWAGRQLLAARPDAVLVTATDGNHGRAVARVASWSGTAATVFVPAVMLPRAAELIRSEGAEVIRVDGDYDAAVRAAEEFAAGDPGRALLQDTAWEGYETVPGWIVEGYETLVDEVDEALGAAPDLVTVPVGVGSLAQAVVSHYRRAEGPRPAVLSVEPDTAACVLASLRAGTPTRVGTAATVMAGLNCATMSSTAWPVLHYGLDAAIVVADDEALTASADLEGLGVSSGPSGAATLAGVRRWCADAGLRRRLDLDEDAVVVLLSTEGRVADT